MRVNKAYYGGKRIARLYKGARLVREFDTLPKGYVRLEYIACRDKPYINTGVYPNNKTGMRCVFVMENIEPFDKTVSYICGMRDNTTAFDKIFLFAANKAKLNPYWNTFNDGLINPSTDVKYDVRMNMFNSRERCINDFKYNDITTTSQYKGILPVLVGAVNVTWINIVDYFFYGRIYAFQLTQDNKLIFDGVPCRNPQGACGLYDRVGKKFYGNSNRVGSFVGREPLKGDALTAGGKLIFNNGSLLIKNKK